MHTQLELILVFRGHFFSPLLYRSLFLSVVICALANILNQFLLSPVIVSCLLSFRMKEFFLSLLFFFHVCMFFSC